jgi:phosphatidylserine/phosphatidylglycerophosphate/cardiolipin synthase-like enzyme
MNNPLLSAWAMTVLFACAQPPHSSPSLTPDTDLGASDTAALDTGTPDDTGEIDTPAPEPAPVLTAGSFSHVGQAVLQTLEAWPASQDHTWSIGGDATFSPGWLLQTPEPFHWGTPVADFDADVTCHDADCHPDFELRRCDTQDDCFDGGTCTEMRATVTAPGMPSEMLCAGHSDLLWDDIYATIVQAESWVDIATLTQPDGRFLAAMRNAVTYLDATEQEVMLRMLYGDIPILTHATDDVIEDLTRDIGHDTALRIHVGKWRMGIDSWNHAKIIAVDGQILIEGGHNLWTPHYLEVAPIHDLSMRLTGAPAAAAHRFLEPSWDVACQSVSLPGWSERSVFPSRFDDCPPPWAGAPVQTPALETGVKTITLGRLGAIGENPADEAILSAIRAAEDTLKFSIQDIGPIQIVGGLTVTDWPDELLRELAYAIERDVTLYLVMTRPGSTPGGLDDPLAQYSNGWTAADMAATLEAWIRANPGIFDPHTDIRARLCDQLHVTTLRFGPDDNWLDGTSFGNHTKMFIVDDQAFYLGSQNLYVANLAEWGVLVDDAAVTQDLLDIYWSPLWQHSQRAAVSGREAPRCRF